MELTGVMELNLTFLSTLFTDDLVRLSRPISYIALTAASLDGKPHELELYMDVSAQHAVNSPSQQVTWDHWKTTSGGATVDGVRLGSAVQHVLNSKGDRVNIDWGYLYLAVESSTLAGAWAGSASTSRSNFVANGTILPSADIRKPRAASDDMPCLSVMQSMSVTTVGASSATFLLGYDETDAIYYFGDKYSGLWTQTYGGIQQAMAVAAGEVQAMQAKSEAHDAKLMTELSAKAGKEYAALCALAYRQTLAATKLVWNSRKGVAWNFLKELSTNGDMQTMDVIFPASPMLLYTSPELLRLLLEPVLAYANNETFIKFGNPYSPHQLGTYPIGNDTTARQEPMPLENSGNMLLMLLALAQREHSIEWFYPKYWPMLTSWADQLIHTLPYPAYQLCTDDFTGHLANNTNLGAKGIVAIEAFAALCRLSGSLTNCTHYSSIALEYAAVWQKEAYTANPTPHYKMAYNVVPGVKDSWSIKYNLLWQKILRLDGPFPWAKVVPAEVAYYKVKRNAFGTPLDPRHTYIKTDWLSWAAAMADDDETFHELFDPIFHFANTTVDRNPFTDLYNTVSGRQTWTSFIARPVIGGIFAKMLV